MSDFSSEELKRYARHFSLSQVGETGQKRLKGAKVLIIGAGGLGCPIALYLASAGVGRIGLIDDDFVSLENLQRQILFRTADIDQKKVEIAKRELNALNPNIKIETHLMRLGRSNALEIISHYDIVIDGSDNFETRYLVNEACVLAKKPLIFGAIFKFDGQLSVFGIGNGPCYACLYPDSPKAEDVPNCSEAGVLGVLPGVVGTLMATEALKIILGVGNVLSSRMLAYDALETQFRTFNISKKPDCKICGANGIKGLKPFVDEIKSDISATTLLSTIENSKPVLIDVRSSEEFATSHLPGSIHIPLNQIASRLDQIPAKGDVIFICQSGKRSARAVEIMKTSGRNDTFQLLGGLDALEKIQGPRLS